MNKNLLILGAGVDQIPGIKKAKELGIYTISLDGNPNASGKVFCDEFYEINIKDYDCIENFLKSYSLKKIDGVIAYGVDIPTIIAKTANFLGVNYTIPLDSAIISEDKYESKVFMSKNNIPIPKYSLVQSIEDIKNFIKYVNYPIIIKPVDNSASRGITVVKDEIEISDAYDYALEFSKSKKIIVEECLSGNQISSESIIVDGKIYHMGFLDRNYERNEMFYPNIIEDGGDMPSLVMNETYINNLTKYFTIICQKLNIKNGVIKGDLIISNNKLYIIEFALRLSGGNFSTICIPNSSHFDIIKLVTMLHLNLNIESKELEHNLQDEYLSMRYKFLEDNNLKPNGIVIDIIPHEENNENIIYTNMHYNKGSRIPQKTTDHSKRLGFVIAKGDSLSNAISNAKNYLDNLEYVVE